MKGVARLPFTRPLHIGIACSIAAISYNQLGCTARHSMSEKPEPSQAAASEIDGERAPERLYHNSSSVRGVTMSIRPSILAGQWYERDAKKLRASIESHLSSPQGMGIEAELADKSIAPAPTGEIRAIVVPHAGHMWSGPTAAAAYRVLKGKRYKRIVILSPNHRVPVYGIVGVSADAFETPLGNVPVDRGATESLRDAGLVSLDDAAHRREHAIEIQLPFIQVVFGTDPVEAPKIVPLIVGDIDDELSTKFSEFYRDHMGDETLIVVSSDFLHYGEPYGYVPFGAPVQPQIEAYDARTIRAFSQLDASAFEEFAAANPHAACGINALRLVSHIYDGLPVDVVQLAYDTSGRRSGDDEMSVSYAALVISDSDEKARQNDQNAKQNAKIPNDRGRAALNESQQALARELVKRALAQAVSQGRETPMPKDDPTASASPFDERYGVFVTLHDASGDLRGCIGNILPAGTLAEGLWGRAQDAALNDPRFDPVTPSELTSLTIEISVLTRPKAVSSPEKIEIGRHGILLKKRGRSAVFLPQVAPEQGWDLETTLNHLSLKAGLSPDAWREGASFEVFEAQVF